MLFGNNEEMLDQFTTEAQVVAAEPEHPAENLRAAAEKSLKENPWATLAVAVFTGFIAGALWKA